MNTHNRHKSVLYTICFAALSALDFVRNTQNGDIWGTAVNLTGLVMLAVIASGWPLKRLLNIGNAVWTLMCIGVSVYALVSIRSTGMDIFMGMYVWIFVTAAANVWWIGMLLADLGKRVWRERTLAIRPGGLGYLWMVMTALMVFSRSGRVWPLWFLAMFGIFYLTPYAEEDRQALADGLVNGTILAFFGLQIFAYGFRPYDVVRYVGAYANSNMAALHYLIVYAAILIKLHTLRARGACGWHRLFYLTGACGMLGFLFLTMGRTAWGTAILITVIYGIVVMRRCRRQRWRQILCSGAALALGAVLLFPAVFGTVRWLPAVLHHPVWFLDEYNEGKVHSFDPPDSWKYVEMDEFLEAVLGRIWGTLQSSAGTPWVLTAQAAQLPPEPSQELELEGSENGDSSLNIRLSIYKAYLGELNLLGHGQGEGMYQFSDIDYHVWHAQNLWLEAAYRYGIPTGCLLAAATIWLLVYHTRRLMSPGSLPRAVVPLLICVIFFGYGTMELVWNTGQYILTLFFVVQHPLFYRRGAEKKRS